MRVRLAALALPVLTVMAATKSFGAASNQLSNPLLAQTSDFSQQSFNSQDADTSLSICDLTGPISDTNCDYETVEKDINSSTFFQTLSTLVQEKYFRFYKVDLYKDCPFWNENSLCMSRDCTVSKVDESQIPAEYREACLSSLKTTDEADVLISDSSNSPATHHFTPNSHDVSSLGVAPDTCQCAETDFCHWEDEEWSPESLWVDLIDNPERFTGYSGPSAHKVWRSIYEENCFGIARPTFNAGQNQGGMVNSGMDASLQSSKRAAEAMSSLLLSQRASLDTSASLSEQCLEKRVFYKIISGLHASISIHICHDYLDQLTGEWKPNLQCFVERIAQHPERLQNVYFNHAVLTRAMAKLAERLGMKSTKDGRMSTTQVSGLLARLAPGLPASPTNGSLGTLLQQSLDSPSTFDEASMFDKSNPESEYLRTEFRDRFRNVSRIMDCVGCDKCRLWGKLQVNGMGTALKILFEGSQLKQDRLLQRSELVAFINTVHRISESIRAVESFREMHEREKAKSVSASLPEDAKTKTASPSTNSTRHQTLSQGDKFKQDSASAKGLREMLVQGAKSVVDRGRVACESGWERCLSWFMTVFDPSQSRAEAKSEL